MNENEIKEDKKNNGILVLVLAIVTVLIGLVGATFAYFTATITKSQAGDQSVNLATESLAGIEYNVTNQIELSNAMPGDEDSTSFEIYNPNSAVSMKYSMELVILEDSFTNTSGDGQLIFSISGGAIVGDITKDFTKGSDFYTEPAVGEEPVYQTVSIVEGATIGGEATHTYDLSISFNELNLNQNDNQGKSFKAYIRVFDVVSA